ncbi:hypothetical protein [Nocardioides mesophilus]|uniref:Sensor domain-containing protein n=1 Tax=Nocardioides mesophilus TaxID=433659 RepID=A0A7G9RCI2_9ACTN|nr:hypothetical protein [Nocardioides mesophilus]QNN53307.1 hypothetical protein H9L09_02175 [Nocardioides mesophilus]
MSSGSPRALCIAVAAVCALTLAACSGSDSAAEPGTPASSTSTTNDASSPPSPDASAPPPPSSGAPRPGSMATPGTRSGPLSRKSFPRPVELGPDWSYAVDPGDAEEGYAGNGTPALARDPREVVLAAVPMGCPRADLPLPAHVLEVDYTAAGVPVIALRASFADASDARRFFDLRADAIRACVGSTDSAGVGLLVGQARTARRLLVSDRTPDSDPWTELAALDGDRVSLVAVHSALGQPPVTARGLQRLTGAFSR